MRKIKAKEYDNILASIVGILILFGLVMISSAGIIYSETRFGDGYYFFKHQLIYGAIPGAVVLYMLQKVDYKVWKKLAFPFFAASVVFLLLVFIPGVGTSVYGANRWIQLGPISFQPSEMTKLSIILYLASWLESRGRTRIGDFYEGLLPFVGILGATSFLILKQPDMGTMGVVVVCAMSMFFVAGANILHIASLGGIGVLGALLLVKLEPYRLNRISAFLNRGDDPLGIGYQISQALLAVGTGGIFGLGLGHSRQKFNYLPEPVGDSIFAIIGEELGFLGAFVLVMLFTFLALRGFKIARGAPDEFGRLVAIGITIWIVFQALVNIGANIAIIPLTGITLPFVSYGGTSLIFLMAAVGILLNISKHSKLD